MQLATCDALRRYFRPHLGRWRWPENPKRWGFWLEPFRGSLMQPLKGPLNIDNFSCWISATPKSRKVSHWISQILWKRAYLKEHGAEQKHKKHAVNLAGFREVQKVPGYQHHKWQMNETHHSFRPLNKQVVLYFTTQKNIKKHRKPCSPEGRCCWPQVVSGMWISLTRDKIPRIWPVRRAFRRDEEVLGPL